MTKTDERTIAYAFADLLSKAKDATDENGIIQSFVKVLGNKKAGEHADSILEELERILRHREGYIEAIVTTNLNLSASEKDQLKETIKKKYKAKDVVLIEKIDEQIIGGIRIQVGDEVFDGTVKNKLQELRKRLKIN